MKARFGNQRQGYLSQGYVLGGIYLTFGSTS